MYNVGILFEAVSIYCFFYLIIFNNFVKKSLLIIIFFFVVSWLFKFIKQGSGVFLYNSVTIENISILLLALYYYYEQIIKASPAYIYIEPRFWIVSAYLVYIAGTFFLLLYIPSLNTKDQLKYYVLNYVFVIIRTILLCVAMFMKNNDPGKQKFKLT